MTERRGRAAEPAPPGGVPGERDDFGIHRSAARVVAHREAFLAGFGVARKGAVGEAADVGSVGFVDHVDDPAGRGDRAQPAEHQRADLGDGGGCANPNPGAAQHAVTHDGVGGTLEAVTPTADACRHVDVVVSGGQGRAVRRADFRVGQRQALEVGEIHRASISFTGRESR